MKKTILLIISLLVACVGFSQSQVIFNKTVNKSVVMRYTQGETTILNQMLQRMAKGNNVNVKTINISYNYNQNLKILKRGDKLNFLANLSKYNFSGKVSYKNFSVSDYFIPSTASFNLKWFKGNSLLNTYNFNNVSMGEGSGVLIADMTITDTIHGANYKITLNNNVFDFNENGKKAFDTYTSYIDDYYEEITAARSQLNRINNINPSKEYLSHISDLNKLFEYRDLSENTLNYALNVQKKAFYKNLPLKEHDPKSLLPKIKNIDNKSKVLNRNCNDLIKNLDKVYFDRGMEMMVRNNAAEADRFFHKSIEINQNYVPSHLQIAKIQYNRGYVDKALNKIFEIKNMQTDPVTKTALLDFAEGMYKDFILEASDLNSRQDFDGALSSLDRAANICRDFAQIMCRNSMDVEYSRAIQGKYFIILRDVDMQIAKGRLKEAERIVNIAGSYRQKNITFIPDNRDLADRINNIYFGYIDRGNNFNKQSYFNKALIEFNDAERICTGYQEINCSVELTQGRSNSWYGIYDGLLYSAQNNKNSRNYSQADKDITDAIAYRIKFSLNKDAKEDGLLISIKQGLYDNLVSTGIKFNTSGNFTSALSNYNQAQAISEQFAIRANTRLGSYITSSAKSLVLKKAQDGEYAVSSNNLTKARSIFNEIRDLQTNYNLSTDNQVTTAVNNLKDKIFKQECINAQNNFDKLYADGLAKANSKNFIDADNLLNKALNEAQKFSQCMIDTRAVNNKKSEIAPAVNFQVKINEVDNLILQNNFYKALNLYEEAYSYYNSANISSFGLSCDNIFDFVQKKRSEFVNYAAGYFTGKGEYEKALLTIKNLKQRNFKVKNTKTVQVELGTKMAIRDYQTNPSSNYYSNIARYTDADKYFKYFMKAYKKKWKKLD